jgi:NitT/TauT family transport system substrate-binding protein
MEHLAVSATAHGLNYLPEYHASATGLLERVGLEVTARARDPWTGVLDDLASGAADLALGGLWVPAMYAGKARDLVVVGQLNARFPMVLVTREAVADFEWGWTTGRTVLVPGAGGTAPYEFMAGLMREAHVPPAGARFVRDLSADMLTELFEKGLGDAILVDLLSATRLEHRGAGYLTCRLADVGGPMPNSVYYARRDRLPLLHGRLVGFLRAVGQAMAELAAGTAMAQDLLARHWPSTELGVLQRAGAELAANGTWSSTRVDPAACARWVGILRSAGAVDHDVAYEELVDNRALDEAELAPAL